MERGGYYRVALVVATLLGLAHGEALSRFIRHYEPLHYDQKELMYHHTRVRRSMVGPNDVSLQFSAFGRYFDLSLKPEKKIFHPNFTLTIDNRVVRDHPIKSYIYSGVDRGDPSVKIHGNVIHGVFEGTIHTPHEDYHVEPAHRYLNDSSIHSVIYRGSDLDLSSINGAGCGSKSEEVQEELMRIQTIHGLGEQRRLRKRQTINPNRDPDKVRCWLNVIGDYKYVQSVGGASIAMVQLINIIQEASEIYEMTNFDGVGEPDMIHFGILDLTVEDTAPPESSPFFQEFLGVQSYLDFHSQANYSDYCLSYRFTSRDFDDGVVGLAYIGPQPNINAAGGICDPARLQNGVVRTLNTGIVTNLNYGSLIPPRISALTFAHEAGHNFGSDHDTAEPDSNGAFIMYAFATDGSLPNNNQFSPRSINERMFPVIADAGQDRDNGCFVVADNFCGNRLLDVNEQCDCGGQSQWHPNGTCKNDLCCYGPNCTLVSTAECSVDQGPCCNELTCRYFNSSVMCSEQTECAMEQQCNGTSALCPPPEPREVPENETVLFCNRNESVCAADGTCTDSICMALNQRQCECPAPDQACDICCQPSINETCVSTFDIAMTSMGSLLPNGEGRRLQIGFPCKEFSGYCDFLNQCMVVDNDGALNRLVNFFLNSQGFQQAIEWITRMWWVVLIVVVGLLVFMFVIVVIFHIILPRPKHRRHRDKVKKRQARTVPLQNYPGSSQGPYYNYK